MMERKIKIQPWFLAAVCLLGLIVMIVFLARSPKVAYTTAEAPPDGTRIDIDSPVSEIHINYGDWWHRAVIILNGHNPPDTIEKLVAGEPIRKWDGYLLWEEGGMPHSVGSTVLSEFKTDHGASLDMRSFRPSSIEVCYLDPKGHITHWSSPLVPGEAKG
jgi:hypothetical protein